MVLGVDEACTNVIRYAYGLRDDQLISLRMKDCAHACACACGIMARKFSRTK
jgi:anti-sigma regulatory factor (Ser/Thr protein kinase)